MDILDGVSIDIIRYPMKLLDTQPLACSTCGRWPVKETETTCGDWWGAYPITTGRFVCPVCGKKSEFVSIYHGWGISAYVWNKLQAEQGDSNGSI